MEEELQDQHKSSSKKEHHLKPWQFKKGQSGNPAGRKPGTSLKEYAKKYLAGMTDEERVDFFEGIDKHKIWEMAEGTAAKHVDITTKGKSINSYKELSDEELQELADGEAEDGGTEAGESGTS